jgi:N-acetylmuramoyl-L-alanine amidase
MVLYKRGSRGEVVRQIQIALKQYPDGIFGVMTEEAVREFQKSKGLAADGVVGPATLAALFKQRFLLKKSKRWINEIIIHCSATPEGQDYTVEDIRRWHKQQGWSDIGYHYVIYRDGTIVNGRDVDITGAHCAAGGHNQHSIGICYIGGMTKGMKKEKDTRTTAQKDSLLRLLKDLKELYPNAKIYGHHDFDRGKACPCFDAHGEYKNL